MRDVLRDAGIDSGAAFEVAGLPAAMADKPGGVVDGVQEVAFQRAFAAATAGRPDLCLAAGRQYGALTFGDVGLAALTAPTLEQFATTIVDYVDFTFSLGEVSLIRDGSGVVIGAETLLADVPPDLREFTIYRDLGMSTRFHADLWPSAPNLVEAIEVPLPVAPPEIAKSGASVRLGDRLRWFWGIEMATRKMPTRNELLHRQHEERCLSYLDRLEARSTIVDRVRDVLRSMPPAARGADRVAAELNMSVRTLQRLLGGEGVKFRDLQRDAQLADATRLLSSGRLPVGEVARRLGYSSIGNFSTAFRAWTGTAPTSWLDENADDRAHPQR